MSALKAFGSQSQARYNGQTNSLSIFIGIYTKDAILARIWGWWG